MAFKYYNNNPLKKRTGDCVIRATALALGKDWNEASDLLHQKSKQGCCEMSCLCCYKDLFDNDLKFKRVFDGEDYITAGEIAMLHKDKVLLIRLDGHLTCSKNGIIYDTWDCSDLEADIAWEVKKDG